MTAANRTRALKLVLAHEGGYVNHPKDPGGATNLGVTQRVYDAWRKGQDLPARTVRRIDMAEAQDIFRRQYWDAVHGDDLPAGVDYAVFDYAVNSGPGKAVRDLQREVGVAPDGKVGLLTITAVEAAARPDAVGLIAALSARRLRYLKTLRTWPTFGRGWGRRVAEAAAAAIAMAKAGRDTAAEAPSPSSPASTPDAPAPAKAPPSDVAAARTPIGQGGLITAIGGAGVTAKAVADTVKGAGVQVAPHLGDGFAGHAAVLALLAIMAVGLMVIGYHVWVRREEQLGRRRPPTLLGFIAAALAPWSAERPA